MKRLLQIEFLKTFSFTGFWILSIFWVAFYILSFYVSTFFKMDIPGMETGTVYVFPELWKLSSWLASLFNLLLATLVMILVCNEFSFRTFRQQVINGLSKTELFKSKVLLMIVFAGTATVLVLLFTIVFGFFYNTSKTWPWLLEEIYYPVVYMIQAFAYMSLGLMIALLIRNIAISIITFISYFVVEFVIRLFLPEKVLAFFPMKIISTLTPFPGDVSFAQPVYYTTINGQVVASSADTPLELPLWGSTAVVIVYIGIFLTISWWLLNKKKL